jgi:hypothetical protein
MADRDPVNVADPNRPQTLEAEKVKVRAELEAAQDEVAKARWAPRPGGAKGKAGVLAGWTSADLHRPTSARGDVVVEDKGAAHRLRKTLESRGYDVEEAGRRYEARRRIQTSRPGRPTDSARPRAALDAQGRAEVPHLGHRDDAFGTVEEGCGP